MSTVPETSSVEPQTNQPLASVSPSSVAAPRGKAGIGGCLLYPVLFLVAQPIAFVLMLSEFSNPKPYYMRYSIYWPYMIYDLVMLGAVALLLVLFVRKKVILPALFVAFLVSFSILSGLLADTLSRLPQARVSGRDPLQSHLVLLFQCLLLIPYFALDGRVKNTFIRPHDDRALLDQLVRPIAAPAERLYGWLARSGKKVFVYTFAFVIGVFVLDWIVDSIVLNVFLR